MSSKIDFNLKSRSLEKAYVIHDWSSLALYSARTRNAYVK